jgi:hypothetical protein
MISFPFELPDLLIFFTDVLHDLGVPALHFVRRYLSADATHNRAADCIARGIADVAEETQRGIQTKSEMHIAGRQHSFPASQRSRVI